MLVAAAWAALAVVWGVVALSSAPAWALLSGASPWSWVELFILGAGLAGTGYLGSLFVRRRALPRGVVWAGPALAFVVAALGQSIAIGRVEARVEKDDFSVRAAHFSGGAAQ